MAGEFGNPEVVEEEVVAAIAHHGQVDAAIGDVEFRTLIR